MYPPGRAVFVRRNGRLTEASRQVAAQQLDAAAFTGARVREYAQALGALQQMGSQLTDSLQAQWRMEQQRAGQVAALAHDLKTPLSIIQGNAELLAEDALTPPQQEQTQAILRGAQRAGLYLEALRAASAPSSAPEKRWTAMPCCVPWRKPAGGCVHRPV